MEVEIWFTTNKKQGLAVKLDDRLEEGKGDIWDTITVFAKRFFWANFKVVMVEYIFEVVSKCNLSFFQKVRVKWISNGNIYMKIETS